jgi:hypothetical protein
LSYSTMTMRSSNTTMPPDLALPAGCGEESWSPCCKAPQSAVAGTPICANIRLAFAIGASSANCGGHEDHIRRLRKRRARARLRSLDRLAVDLVQCAADPAPARAALSGTSGLLPHQMIECPVSSAPRRRGRGPTGCGRCGRSVRSRARRRTRAAPAGAALLAEHHALRPGRSPGDSSLRRNR